MSRIATTLEGFINGFPALLVAAPILVAGIVLVALLGCRDRLLTLVIALPTAIGAMALVGQFFSVTGIHASPLRIFTGVAVTGMFAAALRHLTARRKRSSVIVCGPAPPVALASLGGLGGAAIGLLAWLPALGNTRLPPQANDDIYHGYLIARLASADQISASTMAPVLVDNATPVSYYPYGMHLAMSVDVALIDAAIPVVMKGMWALTLGVLLPFTVAAVVREMFPTLPWAAFWAGLAAPMGTSFFLLNGVMSYAMTLPFALALVAIVIRRSLRPSNIPVTVFAASAVGLFVAHPALAVTGGLLSGLVILELMLSERGTKFRSVFRHLILPIASAALLVSPWYFASKSSGLGALANRQVGSSDAIGMYLTLATPWAPGQVVLGTIALVGLVISAFVLRRGYGLIIAYLLFGVMYVGVLAGIPSIATRTGIWYGQWYRLAGVLSLLAPIFFGVAIACALDLLRRPARQTSSRNLSKALKYVTVWGVILLFGAVGARYALRGQSIVATAWTPHTVTESDRSFFKQVKVLVPPNSQVLNYWEDGSTWIYALEDLRPALPYDFTVRALPWAPAALGPRTLLQQGATCREILKRQIGFAIAKPLVNSKQPNIFFEDILANEKLFHPVLRSAESNTLFRLDVDSLRKCAKLS